MMAEARIPLSLTLINVLRVLQKNAGISRKILAHQMGTTEPTISKAWGLAKQDGLVKGEVVVLDRSRCGFLALGFFRISCDGQRHIYDIGEKIAKHEEVQEVHILDGTGELLVKVCTRAPADLSLVQGKLLDIPGVKEVRGNVVMRTFKETLSIPI